MSRFSIWLERLEFFWFMTQHNWIFCNLWLKRSEPFFECDSKNWTSFMNMTQGFCSLNMTRRIFFNMTPSIEHFEMTHRIEPFLTTQRIEPIISIWLQKLNTFFPQYDSKNWTSLSKFMKVFSIRKRFTDLNPSFQHDS